MPRTRDPAKYPPEYMLLLDRAQLGPVVIPCEKTGGLRGYLQSFLLACESQERTNAPLAMKAKALQVTASQGDPLAADPAMHGPHILVQRRSESQWAKVVASALGTTAKAEVDAGADAFLAGL